MDYVFRQSTTHHRGVVLSSTPIFDELYQEYADRGIRYERLIEPIMVSIPAKDAWFGTYVPGRQTFEDGGTLHLSSVNREPTPKPNVVMVRSLAELHRKGRPPQE
jgi:hypothetical protein